MRQIKFATIGTSNITEQFIAGTKISGKLEHSAVYSRSEEKGKAFSQKHNRTAAQICLRWSIQNGYIPLPKSSDEEHIVSNADVFSFSLDEEDMRLLDELSVLGRMVADPDNPPF